jgi:hypothetical protein
MRQKHTINLSLALHEKTDFSRMAKIRCHDVRNRRAEIYMALIHKR